MGLGADIKATIWATTPPSMESLAADLPDEVIAEALRSARHETVRWRLLPGVVVIWLVIGMALFRDRSIAAVASHLKLVRKRGGVSPGAIVQARDRVGAQPLEAVFAYTADIWALPSADRDRWRGLALYGGDGTTLRVPDSPGNDAEFGRPASAKGRGQSGYPQVRLVCLMALRSHLLLAAAQGAYRTGECTLARKLWYLVPDHSLIIIDRGFIDYGLFHDIATSGQNRHFLCRAKKNLKWTVVRHLGPGDDLVELTISRKARKERPDLPEKLVVRAVQYQVKGFQPQTLLASLLDAEKYPADEIGPLYHERWELEIGYDEVKTHTLEREECLRSRSPEGVRQEVWGVLIAYNLVRLEMERFADKQGLPPRRVSYRNTLLLVRNTCLCASTGVGSIAKLMKTMNEEMSLLVLPERRARRYPRAVKIKMSNYKRNLGRPAVGVAI